MIALGQLRRDPHVLGWMARLRAQRPPLGTASYINLLIALRCIFAELAWNEQLPDLAHLTDARIFHGYRSDSLVRSPRTRTNFCGRSSSAAMIWAVTPFC